MNYKAGIYIAIIVPIFILIMAILSIVKTRIQDKESIIQYKQDSIITETHREQRVLDWKQDSIYYEITNSLDTLSERIEVWKEKANKYDSIMKYEKKASNIRK